MAGTKPFECSVNAHQVENGEVKSPAGRSQKEWSVSEATASKHRSLMAGKETRLYHGGSQFCYSRPRGSSSGVPAGVARSLELSLSFCWHSRPLVLPVFDVP